MKIDNNLTPADLKPALEKFWKLSGQKIDLINEQYDISQGSPVFTVNGRYTTRGWTEWTQGFQYGSELLQFDATGDERYLEMGRKNTVKYMAPHVSHIGVHDHGFNNVSTYGNLLRLSREGRVQSSQGAIDFYELALKLSGAVQASRWTEVIDGGFIHSFNGPHSLFVDTIRSCRSLMVGHKLGHMLMAENDKAISLLGRAIEHLKATAKFSIYYGEGRDSYDEWGRTTHEAIFNIKDGNFRAPNSQQGYSGFTTWTRGLAWAMVGFPEELEFLKQISDEELEPFGGRKQIEELMLKAARATCDWYIDNTPLDGVPYWDGGAPNLHRLGDWRNRNAEPNNDWEPLDSSAATIGAQGLLRLGRYLGAETEDGKRYFQAGLNVLRTLLTDEYLSLDPAHQGLVLHSVYHRPNGWDNIPEGYKVPACESSMWGDYHMRELSLYVSRLADNGEYYTFFRGVC